MKNNDQVGTTIDPHNQNSNINFQKFKKIIIPTIF